MVFCGIRRHACEPREPWPSEKWLWVYLFLCLLSQNEKNRNTEYLIWAYSFLYFGWKDFCSNLSIGYWLSYLLSVCTVYITVCTIGFALRFLHILPTSFPSLPHEKSSVSANVVIFNQWSKVNRHNCHLFLLDIRGKGICKLFT